AVGLPLNGEETRQSDAHTSHHAAPAQGRTWTPASPQRDLVESFGRPLRSPSAPPRSPRRRNSRQERQGAESRRDHPRADRWPDRQRHGHHRGGVGIGSARARRAASRLPLPLNARRIVGRSANSFHPFFAASPRRRGSRRSGERRRRNSFDKSGMV